MEILSDYILDALPKEEKKSAGLVTENRLATINKRETSFEGLVSQFENGEDGIYDLINENGKNTLFKPKTEITEEEIKNNPDLQQGIEAIQFWENKLKTAKGKDAYIAKKAIIDLRKDQYIIREANRKTVQSHGSGTKSHHSLLGSIEVDADGNCISKGVTLIDPVCISAILCSYEELEDMTKSANPASDIWCLMEDFNKLLRKALKEYPIYFTIVQGKISGLQNIQIQKLIQEKHNIKYSVEYISSLWRNKIPGIIAECAENDYLNWYYTYKAKGKYKTCNRCGQTKLAHNKYFSKNKTSKDGWYSICKECRNKKGKNIQ